MKIICDTHVLLFWADGSEKLSDTARNVLDENMEKGNLFCSDISLWEIAMLHSRGRIRQDVEPVGFLKDVLQAMNMAVLPVTPEIAVLAQSGRFPHKDPADRLIGATAMVHRAMLISADEKLRQTEGLEVAW